MKNNFLMLDGYNNDIKFTGHCVELQLAGVLKTNLNIPELKE